MVNRVPVTASLQDYLEAILELTREDKTARVTDIAERLSIAKPSVIQALTHLKEKGLITQDRYGPVRLTEEGRSYASRIRHRHRVIYGFLTQVLGVSPPEAEKDACLIEHDMGRESFDCLLAFLRLQDIDESLRAELEWQAD